MIDLQYITVPGGKLECRFIPDAPTPQPAPSKWLGTNLEGVIDYAPTKPFNNLFYQSRRPISNTATKWDDGRTVATDERGNVTALVDGQRAVFMLFSVDRPSVPLVVSWDGDGVLECEGMKTLQTASHSRLVLCNPIGNVFLKVTKTPVKNIAVYQTDNLDRSLFNSAFTSDLKRYACLRFMDWQRTNFLRTLPGSDFAALDKLPVRLSEGVPLSVMIELCNQTGCDGWWCIPVNADAAYQDKFLAQIKASLKTRAYIELGNEVWNGQFPAARYWDADWNKNMARFCQESAKLAAKVKTVLGSRGVAVVGAQAANAWWIDNTLKLMQAAGTLPDAVAIAPYFGAARKPGLPDDTSLFDNGGVNQDIEQAIGWAKAARAIADKYGVKLVCYEAGQHYVPGVAMNRDPRMGEAYQRYLAALKPLVDMACHFSYVTTYGQSGSWGEGETAPPKGPKAEAIRELQGN
jgi:hypothetical protein